MAGKDWVRVGDRDIALGDVVLVERYGANDVRLRLRGGHAVQLINAEAAAFLGCWDGRGIDVLTPAGGGAVAEDAEGGAGALPG